MSTRAGFINGNLTQTNAPAFIAFLNANANNVLGGGVTYTVAYDTISFDSTSSFNAGTNQYDVPISGLYYFNAQFRMNQLAAAHTQLDLEIQVNGVRTVFKEINPGAVRDANNEYTPGISCILKVTAGQTIDLSTVVTGGAQAIDVSGGSAFTRFQGYLISAD